MANLSSFAFSKAESTAFLGAVAKRSGFQLATERTPLSGTGKTSFILGDVTATLVDRGDRKPVTDPTVDSVSIKPYTFASVVIVDKENEDDIANLQSQLVTKGVTGIARGFDNHIWTGNTASDFFTLENADTVSITDRASFYAALAAASTNSADADGIVLTRGALNQLLGLTNAVGGAALSITETHINGVPYSISPATGVKGVIGAFSQTVWGSVNDVEIERFTEAIEDNNGDIIALGSRNKVAYRIEARLGFTTVDPTAFVKFGTNSGS